VVLASVGQTDKQNMSYQAPDGFSVRGFLQLESSWRVWVGGAHDAGWGMNVEALIDKA
jgi:hypothetical protein